MMGSNPFNPYEPFKINLKKITEIHLINRRNYFKKMLANRPNEMMYAGDSVYAEDAVDAENAHNEGLAEDIKTHIWELEEELKERKIKFK